MFSSCVHMVPGSRATRVPLRLAGSRSSSSLHTTHHADWHDFGPLDAVAAEDMLGVAVMFDEVRTWGLCAAACDADGCGGRLEFAGISGASVPLLGDAAA